MEGRIWFVPGTNSYAYTAACPFLVPYSLSGAFLYIIKPFLISVEDYLFIEANRTPGAIASTLPTFGTKILKPEIYGFVNGQGEI
ncbi:unnamed protein product, partial [marine sediment metagenome]